MKRSVIKAPLNETEFKYRVVLESDECEMHSREALAEQYTMLQSFLNTPALMECGPVRFHTMKMHHDGLKWIIELEAVST